MKEKRKYVARPGIEPRTPDLRVRCSNPGPLTYEAGHLTRKSAVLGSIPGLATYFRFSFRFFQEGQLSVTGESMCTKYWLTA